jgi:hypothetical protein
MDKPEMGKIEETCVVTGVDVRLEQRNMIPEQSVDMTTSEMIFAEEKCGEELSVDEDSKQVGRISLGGHGAAEGCSCGPFEGNGAV